MLLTVRDLRSAMSKVEPDVVEIVRPLYVVATAAPSCGLTSVGVSRILFDRVCDSPSVTNRFATEPSYDLQ